MPVRVEGLDRVTKKTKEVFAEELRRKALHDIGDDIQRRAITDAKGFLKDKVEMESDDKQARIGFLNVSEGSGLWFVARAKEYGTGRQGDSAVSHKGQHWPPAPALALWARARGLNEYAVARKIGERGGLRPDPFLRPALKNAMGRIASIITEFGKEIGRRWNR